VKRTGVLVLVTLLATAGCSSKDPVAAPPPSAAPAGSTTASSGPASPTPSASAGAAVEFTVDGAGPYQLGTTLSTLQATSSVEEVAPNAGCPGNTSARGTGVWRDVRLSFRKDGQLYLAVNRSASIPTPSGAWLGTPLAQLKTIYMGVAGDDLTRGANSAFLVTTISGRGILFDLDPGKKVMSMVAGESSYLRTSYLGGTDFC